MLAALRELMAVATGRCPYAEARHVVTTTERVAVRNGRVARVATVEEAGVGVRVRVGGGWGFAATAAISRSDLEAALARALALADAQPGRRGGGRGGPAALAPAPPAAGEWTGPCERDPLAVAVETKLELLLAADARLRADARIVRTGADCVSSRTVKAFASTEGAACAQTLTHCGAGMFAVAVDDAELQVRSHPAQHGGGLRAGGWEHIESLDLLANAPRVGEEAVALLTAPACRPGRTTVVLAGEQVALQVHESVAHALELDRMLGDEASYAGTSWVRPQDLGRLRYGSEAMHVTADATLPGGLGSFGWDDEGVAARAYPLIESGVACAALSNRESAAAIGLDASGGCARADGHARQPIVRMTNVSLLPGEGGSLEDLVDATDEGLYMETNRSWSIDDRRLHFQFACELGREIHGGELGRLVRNPSYAGATPRFWSSLDAVGSAAAWGLHGLSNCGKGEPGQLMTVSHGAAPARFRDVEVGVA